jgi:hypothetical protein
MRKIRIIEHISLDGVIQSPGRPEEDPSGFAYGGWAGPLHGTEQLFARGGVNILKSPSTGSNEHREPAFTLSFQLANGIASAAEVGKPHLGIFAG